MGLHASAARLETPQGIVFYVHPRHRPFLLDALPEALELPPGSSMPG
jgi:hypothetical protein